MFPITMYFHGYLINVCIYHLTRKSMNVETIVPVPTNVFLVPTLVFK